MYRAPYRSEEVRQTQEPTRKNGVWCTRPLDGGVKPRVGSWFLIADNFLRLDDFVADCVDY